MPVLALYSSLWPRTQLAGQINCNSNTINPITKLGPNTVPVATFQVAAIATLTIVHDFGPVSLTGQINCSSKTFLPYTKLGKAAVPVASFTVAAIGTLIVTTVQGQAQALAGSIICTLKFVFDPNAVPNDRSSLTVSHTLQGLITTALIFNPQFVPQDTAPLNLTITLQSEIDGICVIRDGFTAYFTVAHTATSNIVTGVNISGGSNLAITTQSSCACLAVLSAQLAVDHPLQGSIITILTVNDSFFTVSHTLISQVILSSSLLGGNNLGEASQTGIADVNVFSGILNVDHPLAGSVITILGFQDSYFTVAHPVQGIIAGTSVLRDGFTAYFTVNHTLVGNITLNSTLQVQAGTALPGAINCLSVLSGTLTVAYALVGTISDILIMSGSSNSAVKQPR